MGPDLQNFRLPVELTYCDVFDLEDNFLHVMSECGIGAIPKYLSLVFVNFFWPIVIIGTILIALIVYKKLGKFALILMFSIVSLILSTFVKLIIQTSELSITAEGSVTFLGTMPGKILVTSFLVINVVMLFLLRKSYRAGKTKRGSLSKVLTTVVFILLILYTISFALQTFQAYLVKPLPDDIYQIS